ncbi:helix-turn-helix domain-containing protein [Paenibacillus ottowii]|uniref:Helix-turn-helix domain-containing protein n=1 Tax=Paenibacillus ottowii TaxID=2315729 RepID=A0ABY3B3K7_9BACL|nr:helix-turn-helix transcriptional regulator [Paenibacillus ottowii]TQR97357.1 helix-turn-helix domain-containing protein [Paenibacillus ottowii]
MNYVVKNMEAIRTNKRMTKTYVAKHCGKTITWYKDIAKGRRGVYLDDVLLIAEALEEEPMVLFNPKLSETFNFKKPA